MRWRVVGNGTGASGTLRLDDFIITARSQFDAAVRAIRFLPPFPGAGDSVDVIATVTNAGIQPIQNILAEFFVDKNGDSLPQADELLASSKMFETLLPNDSAERHTKLFDLTPGPRTIIVKATAPGDQNIANDIRTAVLLVGLSPHSVVINEIMYAPSSGEPEWIELFNATSGPVELQNWKLGNRNTSTRYLLTSVSSPIQPRDYIVVTKDSALFHSIHPFTQPVLQSTALPTFLFNNNGDAVVLYDARGAMTDSVRYAPTWGGTNGSSLERIEAGGESNDPSNWGTSGDPDGSTPGKQNYLTPLGHDLRILRISHLSIITRLISVTVQNTGDQPAGGFSVSVFDDLNQDTVAQPSELLDRQFPGEVLSPKDSISLTFSWSGLTSGKRFLIASIEFAEDERISDNIKYDSIKVPFPQNSLIINEIMYSPKPGGAEYVELFNRGTGPVDVYQWRLSSERDTNARSGVHVIGYRPPGSMVIPGGGYLLVSSDSSIFRTFPYLLDSSTAVVVKRSGLSLNNSGDNVLLTDLTGQTIDSLFYFPAWQNPAIDDPSGRSLERINPFLGSNDGRNWSTSANLIGGTPGRQNSIYTIAVPSTASISFMPNPFSPDGDGFEDVTVVSYRLTAASTVLRVRIFDSMGRLVRTLADGEPAGASGELIWDGFTDSREKANIGIYIVLLESTDSGLGSVSTVKGVVVVAAKM
jgi:hypothetical protein